MGPLIRVICRILSTLLYAVEVLLVVRAVMSWFVPPNKNKFTIVIHSVTEVIVRPMRLLVNRIPALRGLPIDMASLFTLILVGILSALLPY